MPARPIDLKIVRTLRDVLALVDAALEEGDPRDLGFRERYHNEKGLLLQMVDDHLKLMNGSLRRRRT